ncbi:MAG: hypothetical protein JWM82_3385, partial [Myxococcales bacterium]|nr:hypothetical protein [Myxococcales bacterium]
MNRASRVLVASFCSYALAACAKSPSSGSPDGGAGATATGGMAGATTGSAGSMSSGGGNGGASGSGGLSVAGSGVDPGARDATSEAAPA